MSTELIAFPAKSASLVPLFIESFLADALTPVTAFEKLRELSEYAFLFESSEADSRLARFSIVGVDPKETLIFQNGKVQILDHLGESGSIVEQICVDPLSFIEQRTGETAKPQQDALPAELPFVAGYVGYFSYNAISSFEEIRKQSRDELQVPDGVFSLFDALLIFDHKERTLHVVSMRSADHVNRLIAQLEAPAPSIAKKLSAKIVNVSSQSAFSNVQASMTKEQFVSKVQQCKQFVEDGQVFQIVLAQRFSKKFVGNPFDIYRALQSINPSPYGYFLQFPEFSYLGASPERLLSSRNGHLALSALAGTRPRGKSAQEELELENDLRSDEKEMAEHLMLVDLGRNDLGRVAAAGTVRCGEIARITRYGQVMHLTTDISAELAKTSSSFDAVRSCFPAGTVSGAPKIRAMELLSEVEPECRGIYSGLVGYFDLFGNMDSAIAIRSALLKNGVAHVTAGAGIVQDSVPEKEYEETRSKAASVLKAIAMAEAMQ